MLLHACQHTLRLTRQTQLPEKWSTYCGEVMRCAPAGNVSSLILYTSKCSDLLTVLEMEEFFFISIRMTERI
jgi:hypothetical protein